MLLYRISLREAVRRSRSYAEIVVDVDDFRRGLREHFDRCFAASRHARENRPHGDTASDLGPHGWGGYDDEPSTIDLRPTKKGT